MLWIVVLLQVKNDSSRFEDCKVVAVWVDKSWDSSIWVDLAGEGRVLASGGL